jgi:hypothetical protein
MTYKGLPGDADARITVGPVYGVDTARGILAASRRDYDGEFPSPSTG